MTSSTWHAVTPLQADVASALGAALRKLSHDINNSLVAGTSHLDLLTLRLPELRQAPELVTARQQLQRPRRVVAAALAALPGEVRERPRTATELADWWLGRGAEAGLATSGSLPLSGRWATPPATLALYQLLTNVAEAMEETRRLEEPLAPVPMLQILQTEQTLTLRDNGPGCQTLELAASGRQRRAGAGHLGLGLATAAAAMQELAGELAIASAGDGAVLTGGGFQVQLRLP
jgi:hypothetical protein